MAIISIPRGYASPMRYEDKVRNGKVPDWRVVANAAYRHAFALCHLKKLVFFKSVQPGATPQSVSGTVTPWRWQCRTGESSRAGSTVTLIALAQVLPASNLAGTDPRWRFFAGANNSAYRHTPAEVTSPTYADITLQQVTIRDLAPNTEYQCGLEVVDYGRVLSLMVYEAVSPDVDTGAPYASDVRSVGNGLEITDADHAEACVTDPYTIWKHNGAQLCNLVPDTEALPWTTTSASYVNLLQSGHSTTVSANTAGVNLEAQYHGTAETYDVACVFAVFAKSLAANGNDAVILKDDNGTILGTLSAFGTTAEWKSVAITLNASALRKCDLQFRDTGGQTFSVYAVSLYEYET